MSLTNKEIEEAREVITEVIMRAFGHPMRDRIEAKEKLDALCAAARQPDSLVGKRVRFNNKTGANGQLGIVLQGPRWRIRRLKAYSEWFERDDFELLEDANPLDGVWRCEACGEMLDIFNGQWRMASDRWQHSHGQAGHIDAQYFGPELEGKNAK